MSRLSKLHQHPQSILRPVLLALFSLLLGFTAEALAPAQIFDVSGKVDIHRANSTLHSGSPEAVFWLTPLSPAQPSLPAGDKPKFVLAQKDKQFVPHLLVVPVGSSIDFPNLDPFFHNVFSLFNGKRFDLGLYEGHTHRSVQFDREGVSYIFCNIHPDMGAVVVSLRTPYYAVSSTDGSFVLHGVPAGRYRLNVWTENATAERLAALARVVEITPQHTQLGIFPLEVSGDAMSHHANKFGEAYKPLPRDTY